MASRSEGADQQGRHTEDAGRAYLGARQLADILAQWQLPYPVQLIPVNDSDPEESEALAGFVARLCVAEKTDAESPFDGIRIQTYLAAHAVRGLETAQYVALVFKWKDQRYRTAPVRLRALSRRSGEGHVWHVAMPEDAQSLYTRNHFRAHLHERLIVEGILHRGDRHIKVRLLDISAGGCRLLVPVREGVAWWQQISVKPQAASVNETALTCQLQLAFPSGEWLEGRGSIRSVYATRRGLLATVGICFDPDQEALEEQAMRVALETERESARLGQESQHELLAAPLYQGRAPAIELPETHEASTDHSPLQQVLDHVAAVLCQQALRLAHDEPFDSELIRQASLSLLKPLEQQPEALMYALVRLHGWPSIVRHCMLVATRLYLLAVSEALIDPRSEALLASALLHDVGKLVVHLPVRLSDAVDVRAQQSEQLRQVLLRVLHGLHAVNWIPRRFLEAALVNPHERLDGSGVPRGLKAGDLDSLSRMAAVVDKIDLLTYANDCNEGVGLHDIISRVLGDKTLDQAMVACYVEFFGTFPVGSLVQFSGGALAWVLSLGETGLPASVEVAADNPQCRVVAGEYIAAVHFASRLGKLKGHAAPSDIDAWR